MLVFRKSKSYSVGLPYRDCGVAELFYAENYRVKLEAMGEICHSKNNSIISGQRISSSSFTSSEQCLVITVH
jgi:hypothetical protein